MDYVRKARLGRVLRHQQAQGTAVLMATHDVELVASLATRVVLLGDGEIIADGPPREVLSGSLTFATQINKLYGDGFLTVEDVVRGLPEGQHEFPRQRDEPSHTVPGVVAADGA
jgi:energy-coupling factor transport system ATP-binding protein